MDELAIPMTTTPDSGSVPTLFRSLMETTASAIFIYQEEVLRYVNPAMETITGYSRAELLTMRFWDFVHPDHQELIRSRGLARQRGKTVPWRYEFKILTKNGQERWVDFTSKFIKFQGSPAALGTAFDITERVQAQNALRRRAEELTTLHSASLKITAPHDLTTLLETIVEQAARLLGAPGGSLYLCDPEKEELRLHVEHYDVPQDYAGITLEYGEGAAGLVAQTKKPLIIDDYRAWPGRAAVYEVDQPYEAVLSVPMIWQERTMGVLQVLADKEVRRFSQADQELLGLFANQAATAVQNARLFDQAVGERRRLGVLYDVGRALAASLNPDEILTQAIALACQGLGGAVGEACLYLPGEGRLSLRALYGREMESIAELDKQLNLTMGTGLVGWVAQNRKSANVPDVSRDPRWLQVSGLDDDVNSALAAPILEGDQLLGTLSVLHRDLGFFSDDHLDWLGAICQQVSLALSNARRYQDVNRLVDLLEAEQDRLEGLIEELPVGVLLLDEKHNLLLTNPRGDQILSTLAPNGGRSGTRLTHLGHYSITDLFAHHANSLPVEITLEGPPRAIYEAQIRSIGGETRQWVLTLREVTQEREYQHYLHMQDRLATVGQLAAGIAHDFNNIMAAIVVYTDLLLMEPRITSEGYERLNIIQKQVKRAASLIRQILDFSRRSVMEQSSLDLLPFIKEVDKMLRRMLPETIQLELGYKPGEYLISADPTRIQQVFMNLAVNARDAMPDGGKIHFGLDRVHIQSGDPLPSPDISPGEWVRITVMDTGTGIPPDELQHIFEPFFTTKPVGEGTGLGLAQVYGIIKQHGGHINVQSQVGVGTTFEIHLPVLESGEGGLETQEVSDINLDGGGRRLLLVEDDLATRRALQTLLEVYNYQLLIASNGAEALRLLEEVDEPITLAISDVVMPEMGGLDLYRALRERWPEIKMLFITGHPLDSGNQSLLEAGRVHWLQKPFSIRELNHTVHTLLED